MKSPTWEPSVLAIHMELWATACFGVTMGELRSRPVCVTARLRDRVGEQKVKAGLCDSRAERQHQGAEGVDMGTHARGR